MGDAKMHSFVLASTDFTFKRNGKSCPTRISKFEPEIIHIYVNKMNHPSYFASLC
jgi:hypothetical protein